MRRSLVVDLDEAAGSEKKKQKKEKAAQTTPMPPSIQNMSWSMRMMLYRRLSAGGAQHSEQAHLEEVEAQLARDMGILEEWGNRWR